MRPSFHFSCYSCRRRLVYSRSSLRVKDNMLHKLTLIQVWPALEMLRLRIATMQSTVLLTDERRIPGDKDADTGDFLSISSLVRWRCFFYLDLFKSRTGQALQLAREEEGYAECKFMRISMFFQWIIGNRHSPHTGKFKCRGWAWLQPLNFTGS